MPIELSEKEKTVLVALADLDWMQDFPPRADQLEKLARIYARFVETAEVEHADLGRVSPLRWLVEQIESTLDRFPKPIQARRIYETRFAPLDQRSAGDLEQAASGTIW